MAETRTRTRRGVQTRERILDATVGLLALRPIGEISLAEVCIAADVSSGSLYHLFRTKTELAAAVHARLLDAVEVEVERGLDELLARPLTFRSLFAELLDQATRLQEAGFAVLYSLEGLERDDRHMGRERAATGTRIAEHIARVLAERIPTEDPATLESRARFMVRVAAALMARWLISPHIFDGTELADREAMMAELAEMACAYLGVDGDALVTDDAARRHERQRAARRSADDTDA